MTIQPLNGPRKKKYVTARGDRKRKTIKDIVVEKPVYTALTACRACGGSELADVFSLGDMCINAFPKPDEPDPPKAPLTLCLCAGCSLLQLRHTVNPDLLFKNFHYRSATTATMRTAMKDIVTSASKHVDVGKGDFVVDIGSNDGTLLRCWPEDVIRIGFEPAENLRTVGKGGGNIIYTDYFTVRYMRGYGKKAKVITAIAMFYDLPAPVEFLKEVHESLDDNGIFVCQFSYLPAMLDMNDLGNIVHEHLLFLSLSSTAPMFEKAGLCIYDVEFNNVNGGSIRIYASKKPRGKASIVNSTIAEESARGLAKAETYTAFGERCHDARMRVLTLIEERRKEGAVYILGASTKGQLLVNYYGLTKDMIAGASERDKHKHGREMVGSRIPIVNEEEARMRARTLLILPWQFFGEIVDRERAWLAEGGRMIVAQPTVRIVGSDHMGTPTVHPVE